MIDKPIKEHEVQRNCDERGYTSLYYYLDDDLNGGTSTLKFFAEGLHANGNYQVSIDLSTEELLILLKSHLANKSFDDIAKMLVNLSADNDTHSGE